MKYRLWMLPALALGSGVSAGAMANDSALSYGELEGLLEEAGRYGFSRYEKFDVDHDDGMIELEGWREDGWELDVAMRLNDGELLRESQRRSTTPDWSLDGDELRAALEQARQRGMQRFTELEVDSDGHIEIEGYRAGAASDDFDLDLHRDDLDPDDVNATGETG
ncbi:hypothetical protein [Salinicola avicenniae]|uniref:hypothetical protein n=1 Tax=Salinicola avicenniae TaxID=2916836 RepID=UPI0020741D01|nr:MULTISPECIES: hypothetical protein [unclassified Salinicola]